MKVIVDSFKCFATARWPHKRPPFIGKVIKDETIPDHVYKVKIEKENYYVFKELVNNAKTIK